MRQVILDTETTGLRTEDGHRIIEIGCLEMIDRKLTGKHYHQFINPKREIESGAVAIHGITNAFLSDKPIFDDIAGELMDFISGSELIIHNAPFDLAFLNYELSLLRKDWSTVTDYCGVIDTLQLARKMHAGQRNNLDALCKRYAVDNSKRDVHGALVDAHLLAQVYLAMTGGQGNFFDSINESQTRVSNHTQTPVSIPVEKHDLIVLKANPDELLEHKKYVEELKSESQWD